MLKHPLAIVVSLGLLGHFALVAGQSGGEDQTARNALAAGDSTESRSNRTANEEISPQASAEAKKLYKMGVKYGRARLFRQAAESFQKAVELKPDFSDAHYGLGHAYFDLGRWQESIQSLERALELNPKDVDAYTMLGEAYVRLRRETNTTSQAVTSPVPQKHADGVPVSLKSETTTDSINSTPASEDLTRVYRVGAGDVLDIRLSQSSEARSTLFTVTPAGLLEHPNLTEPLPVAGLTVEEIATRLEEDFKRRALNENPTISVGVRDYMSHTILVSGLVKEPGTKILRREAIPLYVVIADAQPMAEAGRATLVRRDTKEVLDIELTDSQHMDRLVRPGDVITLHPHLTQYFYVGGEVKSAGEKPYRRGLTLTQAILAAGGLTRDAREAQLARDSGNGFLAVTRFKLKDLNSGKLQDPPIQPGDRITIVH